ncbi:ParB N-terminal domain-containing protein [Xenophilus sp. Marseille-Q4582]|uniref:ParB/RepB/Spo0J family partition protein n=1 Tax=Xenophilus sp. Marseille-Q4582 TaxID=2866600 RepID=UPI001CE4602B|nr:ParB N-terminal domain-containing protein [Xenophilus sp. Marseille-Q4582]
MALKQHPLSAAFPAMSAEEYQGLVDSITVNGVLNPITVFEGMVLDGWHRYTAANEVGVDCPSVELADVDPRDFVMAQNKARRHTTQAQLALATTAVFAWFPADGAAQRGGVTLNVTPPKSNAELAAIAGVHPNTITQAKTVQTKAAPEVQEAVKRGDIGLPKAAAIAKLPKEEQAAAIHKPAPKSEPVAVNDAPEYDGPSEEELRAHALQEQADREALDKLMESDDKLAAAYAEIKRLNAVNAALESRLQGLMNEKNEAIRMVKSLQRKLDKVAA